MQYPVNFNKDLFTQEELSKIEDLVSKGLYKYIPSILSDVDPIKEYHLQLLLNAIEPRFVGFENKVRTSLDELKRDGFQIENPKQEEAIDELIKEELELNKKRVALLNSKEELLQLLSSSKQEDKEVKEKLKEVDSLLTDYDKRYKSSYRKEELKGVLDELIEVEPKVEEKIEEAKIKEELDKLNVVYDKRLGLKKLKLLLEDAKKEL